MSNKDKLKVELARFMHEMINKNKEVFDTGNYNALLNLCEQDISILSFIYSSQDTTAKGMSIALKVPKTTIVSAVSRLENKGYLIKKQNENDRRENYLYLTNKGKMAHKQHVEYENLILDSISNMWDIKEQDEVTVLLQKRRRLV